MKMTFRWFGEDDPIPLYKIRQIPGVSGVVSAIYDIPVGSVWSVKRISNLKSKIEDAGLEWDTVESVPVHEDIKLGCATKEQYIQNYQETLVNLGNLGFKVVCYNFMPVVDWTRSTLDMLLPDGSTTLAYQQSEIDQIDLLNNNMSLPGWDESYTKEELITLLESYKEISTEGLWQNLSYFLEAVIPTAEKVGIKMAIHPDDPPWSVFGLPRIIKDKESLNRLINLVDSPSNGLSLCSGSLGVNPENNIAELIRYFGKKERIHFAHVRNINISGANNFNETSHRSEDGSLDIFEIMKAYHDTGFIGPMRPDHGRMIWDETGKPGYGLFDRALGSTYLNGIWEALNKQNS